MSQGGLFDEITVCPRCRKPEPREWCWDGRTNDCPMGYGPRYYGTDRANARHTDPITSHEAAASLQSDVIRASQQAVYECFQHFGPMYDEEFIQKYGWAAQTRGWPSQSPSGLRSRRSELVKQLGRLEDSGEKVFPPGKNRRAIVWQLARGIG